MPIASGRPVTADDHPPAIGSLRDALVATRFALFTGKGGVGKTTVASAAAVALADRGRSVLLVSTDPASNLADVFQTATGDHPTPAPGVTGLDLIDIDPQAAAAAYRERVIAPYRDSVTPAALAAIQEQLAGACTVEVAAFDAFTRLLADPAATARYHHVVFDTAPTGHTLRLLSLPSAWSHYLAVNPEETTCLGPLAGLQGQRPLYERAVAALADPIATTLVLVARPERAALVEAARAGTELTQLGLTNQRLVINGMLTHPLAGDQVATSYARHQHDALAHLPSALSRLPRSVVPLAAFDVIGVDALRTLTKDDFPEPQHPRAEPEARLAQLDTIDDLVDALAREGPGVSLVTGKGGVGKTRIALRIAHGLSRRGLRVRLATTDPAGHLPESGDPDLADTITVSHIDPQSETDRYIAEQLEGVPGQRRDAAAEELRSPCTTEVAVFRAFGRLLGLGRTQHVVIDTAPTGHTLLLLDVTGAFHRQVMRDATVAPARIITPLMRLQDPKFSRVILVCLPETTPVAEAADLQEDLRRAGIEPYGWVINASLAAGRTDDPVLSARAHLELPQIDRVTSMLATHVWLAAWDPDLGDDNAAASTLQRAHVPAEASTSMTPGHHDRL